jgi:hypothetical protein
MDVGGLGKMRSRMRPKCAMHGWIDREMDLIL